jgi:rubrerythrin
MRNGPPAKMGSGRFNTTGETVLMKEQKVHELLYEALETEIGGQQVYRTAIQCARNEELKHEWEEYLEQTANHERILRETFRELGLDDSKETPGRKIVRHHGESLVKAMQMAKQSSPESAEVAAAECIVLAETKDHQNWTLLNQIAEKGNGKLATAVKRAVERVEDEEDEHLYHTMGWTRELWIESLGMPAVIPPPEEEKRVKTMIGAARAAQSRESSL